LKQIDHNIGFREKRHFFRRKWGKIAENCDHNIDSSTKDLLHAPLYSDKMDIKYLSEFLWKKSRTKGRGLRATVFVLKQKLRFMFAKIQQYFAK
jgi:hypothetical protein